MLCMRFLVLALAAVLSPAAAFADFISLNVTPSDFVFDGSGVLYITSGSQIVRYDTNSKTYLSSIQVGGTLRGIDLSSDGKTLAVADAAVQGASNRIALVSTATGSVSSVSFTRDLGETGTFMVAWNAAGQVYTTSNYGGSGWVPLRLYDPATGSVQVLDQVRQLTMLTPSADRLTIAMAEANIGSGPIHAINALTHAFVASQNIYRFTYEIAVNRNGSQYVVPTADGALIYRLDGSKFTQIGLLSQDGDPGPVGAVFAPRSDYLFTAESAGYPGVYGVKVYDSSYNLVKILDPYHFDTTGNFSLRAGRMEISPDGRWLAVSVGNGVRLYDVSAFDAVPEPSSLLMFATLLVGIGVGRRRFRAA